MIVDTHIHLNDKQYYNDIDTIIANAGGSPLRFPPLSPSQLGEKGELNAPPFLFFCRKLYNVA